MTKHQKTLTLIATARAILATHHPMTVRQVYYQLVSRQVIENSRGSYQAVSNALVDARKEGTIPWEWIEDRIRRPRGARMWDDPADFAETAKRLYRRDVWADQPAYVECWLEKDALSGLFEDLLSRYGVILNVGRGYDGWSSIKNAAYRYRAADRAVTVLYFGDFDPSGENMADSLRERLAFFGYKPEVIKCALTAADIARYDLPPDFAKRTDTRAAKFIAKHGDVSVELDALPIDVLQARIVREVESRLDLAALAEVHRLEADECADIEELLSDLS